MTPDGGFLENVVVLQSFRPLDEALDFGVVHVRLPFVVTCGGDG